MNSFPFSELIVSTVFVLCLMTLGVGALIAVLSARLIRSVTGLAIAAVGLAGLYYFLHSPFLALMEILIYVGAVCVTIVFAIMLAEPDEPARPKGLPRLAWGAIAVAVAGAIFFGITYLGTRAGLPLVTEPTNAGSIESIGRALLSTYSLAFELISLALLVAILGALAIARTGRTRA